MIAKNPRTPPRDLTAQPEDFVTYDRALWRIHRLTGQYRQQWNEMRATGPLPQMRWDPHHETSRAPGAGHRSVSYAATDVLTAFAEVFHSRRRIVLSRHQGLVAWIPGRPLRLLDLTPPTTPGATSWSLRNGASASLDSAVKPTCRAWARAIADTWPTDLDGLYVRSTVTGQSMVTLFAPAASSFPAAPSFSRRLDDPVVAAIAVGIANSLGWQPPIVR